MADDTKRIYELGDETDLENSYIMSDKSGRPEALKILLSLLAKKTDILPKVLAADYLDFNYVGYATLNGVYYLSGLGINISNSWFTPLDAATYLIRIVVDNVTGTLHFINMTVNSADDPAVINRQASRMGASFAAALLNQWSEFTHSPFAYVAGIQQVQETDDQDRVNTTGDWLTTGVIVHLEELSSTSILRFDASFLTSGATGASQVQFRILENGSEVALGGIIAIGNDTISNSFSFIVDTHSAIVPTDYEIEFKNVGGTITILGSEKAGSLIVTETFQTTR